MTGRVQSVAAVEFKTNGTKWPDAQRVWSGVTERIRSCKNLTVLWPDALTSLISDDRTHLVSEVPLWNWTGRTVDVSDRFSSRVRSQHLPLSDSGQPNLRVRSRGEPRPVDWIELQWLPALTGRVQSRQRPRSIERKWLKRLRIVTQLEPSFFQLNFGLHLSYLVLSLTSVHHT
jgi:hypothetical protein